MSQRGLGVARAVVPGVMIVLSLAGCQQNQGSSAEAADRAASVTAPTKILTVMEENHSYAEMRAQMPYLAGLAERYGYATDWTALRHPSLPNYLAITGGSTFDVGNNLPPKVNSALVGDARSVFDQALDAGLIAKTYSESMDSNCQVTDNEADYVYRHNPWVYYSASADRCGMYDVATGDPATGPLATDIAANSLPNAGLVQPNQLDNAHDGDLAGADAWLQTWLPDVLESTDFTEGNLVVVVTADEDDHTVGNDNKVLTVVLHPGLSHVVVDTPLTHYSLTRYYAQVLGTEPLLEGGTAPDMQAAFGLPR